MFSSNIFANKKGYIITLVIAVWFCIFSLASADWDTDGFRWLVNKSIDEGMASSGGKFDTWADTEANWANKGNGVFHFPTTTKSNRFIIAFTARMTSATRTTNTWESGCGLTWSYRESDVGMTELMASANMDGFVYIYGWDYGKYLSYGKYYYGSPSNDKTVDLAFVVKDDKVNVYVGRERLCLKIGMPILGSRVGFVVNSGTNMDFGVRCKFRNIHIYTW